MQYKIETATPENCEEILALYRSLAGKNGCTWTDEYPGIEDVRNDIKQKSLYVAVSNGAIAAAAAAGRHTDLDAVDCYDKTIEVPCDLSRVAVRADYQNKGLARFLIGHIEAQALQRGFDGLRLLVSKNNRPAIALYTKLRFTRCGECRLYDMDWYCYEKKLS